MKKYTIWLLVIILYVSAKSQNPQRKLLFIGIDGCRWDALVAANTPNIDNLLLNSINSPHGLTFYETWSGTGWSNMLTGAWHTKHGVTNNSFTGSNYSQYPDFISRVENFNPNLNTISVAHWSPINTTIIQSIDKKVNVPTDLAVKDTAVAILTNANPDVLFIDFDDVDHAGHSFGFSPGILNYKQVIETTDNYVGAIVTALHNRPNYANEDWLIIVTTDHGGIPAGHGGGTLEERTIFNIYSNHGFTPQTFSRTTVANSSVFNEAHFNAGTYAQPANQAPFLFGTSQDFTIEFWVKAGTYASDPAFISNKNWNSGVSKGFVISAQQGQYWKVNIGDGTNRIDIQGGFIQPNQWHHLAVSFNRTGLITAYEDGVVVGFKSMQNIGDINSGLPLVINQDGTTTYGYNFDGSIKDIRIWNSVIPAATIVQWATIPLTSAHPNYSSLLANWKCIDGSGNVLHDAGISGNHCNVTGSLTWNSNQTTTFTAYDYSATPREPDNAVTAMNWLCVPIQPSWNLDGKSWTPFPTVSASGGTICSGKIHTISVAGANTYSINGIGVTNFTVNPVVNTNYSVTGTKGCKSSNTAIAAVTVYSVPLIHASSGTICAGNTCSIAVSGAASYSINGSGINSFTFSPAFTTSYSITGTNLNGCVSGSAAIATITVYALPVVTAGSGFVCTGGVYTLNVNGASSYSINGSSASSFTVSPVLNTTYSVTGTSSLGCISANVAVASVTVLSLPVLSANGSTICANEIGTLTVNGANSYTWSTGETGASVGASPSVTTVYSVQGTDNNGCIGSNSVTLYVDVCAAISELADWKNDMRIYPNPVNEILNVKFDRPNNDIVLVFNAYGQEIIAVRMENSRAQIDVSILPKGIFYIKVGTKTQKFVKS